MAAILDFIALNGYGVYVWPAYGCALLVLGGLGWWVGARLCAAEAALARLQAQADGERER